MDKCKFDVAWVGRCNKETVDGAEYCPDHILDETGKGYSKGKCCVCGEQATHECDETFQFVCGSPLCDKESCKIRHHSKNYKFTPAKWAGIYGFIGYDPKDFARLHGTEITSELFLDKATKKHRDKIAEQIVLVLEKAYPEFNDTRAYGDFVTGEFQGSKFNFTIKANI